MSESIKTICETIIEYGLSYKQSVINALETYRKEKAYARQDSEKYKDSADYYTQKQHEAAEKALSSLKSANNHFKSDMSYTLDKYRDNVKNTLLCQIDRDFMPTLHVYSDYGIPMNRIEIEALVKLTHGNVSALNAINKVLEQTESGYTITFSSIADYDKAITELAKLSIYPYYIPGEYLAEGKELYKNIPWIYVNDSLIEFPTGREIDDMNLLLYGSSFDKTMESVQQTISAFENASKITITKTNTEAVNQARELGKAEVVRNNTVKEGLKQYL